MLSKMALLLPAVLLLLSSATMGNEHDLNEHGERVEYPHEDAYHEEVVFHEGDPPCKMIEERINTCYVLPSVELPLSKECLSVTSGCHPKDEVCSTEVVRRQVCRQQEEHGIDKRQASQPLTPGNIPGLVPGSAAEAQWWSQQIAHKGQVAHHIERRQSGPTRRSPTSSYPVSSLSAPAPSYSTSAPSYSTSAPSYSTSAPSYSAPDPSYPVPAHELGYTRDKRQAGYQSSYSPLATHSAPAPSYSAPALSYSAPAPSYSPRPRYKRHVISRTSYSALASKASYPTPTPSRYKRQSSYTDPAPSYPASAPTYSSPVPKVNYQPAPEVSYQPAY